MLSNVKVRCGVTRPQRPSPRTLLLLLSTQVQTFLNEANLSYRPWAVEEADLVIPANTEEFPISINNFGKPIQVRSVYRSDPSFIERDVEFTELGDANFDWAMPSNYGSAMSLDNSPNNALRIAFYRKAGQNMPYARVMPIPSQTGTYKVLYMVGVYGDVTPLDETPVLPEHHALIELRTADAALPHCEWHDDERANHDKRVELHDSFVPDLLRLERNFRQWIASMSGNNQPNYREFPYPID